MKMIKELFLFGFIGVFVGSSANAVTTDKISYGTSTSISCPGASSLASSATAAVSCVAIDNTSSLAVDELVTVSITSGASAPANDQTVYVYSYASEDGSTYEQEESSSPANGGAYTLDNPNHFKLVQAIYVTTASK